MTSLALVLDTEAGVRETLVDALRHGGYEVVCAVSTRDALARISSAPIGLVLANSAAVGAVDILVGWLRLMPSRPAVIVLDAAPSVAGGTSAFRSGAADYLPLPCPPEALWEASAAALARRAHERRRDELISAVGERLALLRELYSFHQPEFAAARSAGPVQADTPAPGDTPLVVGALWISRERRTVLLAGEELPMTPIEHRLLVCLAAQPNRVLSYRAIARATHGYEVDEGEAMTLIKTHIRNLRRKLPQGYLVSERGSGYMLTAPALVARSVGE